MYINTLPAYNTGTIIVDSAGNVTLTGGTFPSNAFSANGQVWIGVPQPPSFYAGIWQIGGYASGMSISLANYNGPLQPLSLASGAAGVISGTTFTWGTPTTATVGQNVIIYSGTGATLGAYAITVVNGTTSVTLGTAPGNATGVSWSLSASSGVGYNLTFNHYALPAGFDSFEEDLTEPGNLYNHHHRIEPRGRTSNPPLASEGKHHKTPRDVRPHDRPIHTGNRPRLIAIRHVLALPWHNAYVLCQGNLASDDAGEPW